MAGVFVTRIVFAYSLVFWMAGKERKVASVLDFHKLAVSFAIQRHSRTGPQMQPSPGRRLRFETSLGSFKSQPPDGCICTLVPHLLLFVTLSLLTVLSLLMLVP